MIRTLSSAASLLLVVSACATPLSARGDLSAPDGAARISEPRAEPTPADGVEAVRDALWKKEIAIYEGRSRGDLSYYVANASPAFLAWTSGTKEPFRKDALEAGLATMKGRGHEVITHQYLDISLSGDTAIFYYRNHRTRLPDGTVVDQRYDNIHVWQWTDGVWKVLASMSRHAEE
jgi:hypothetical protein